jgi:hypothetical protein
MIRFFSSLVIILLVIVSSLIASSTEAHRVVRRVANSTGNFTPLPWQGCATPNGNASSPLMQFWGASLTPSVTYLGQPWTIYFTVMPTFDITPDMEVNCIVNATYEGKVMHSETISLCTSCASTDVEDGFCNCPYNAGVPVTFHDTNTLPDIPFLIPKGPYFTTVQFVSPQFPNVILACFSWYQTYAN